MKYLKLFVSIYNLLKYSRDGEFILTTKYISPEEADKEIPTVEQKTLLYVSPSNYYLQSANYEFTNDGGAGMKIDLYSGQIDAYNFKLISGNFTLANSINPGIGTSLYNWWYDAENTKGNIIFNANNLFAITSNGHIFAQSG